MKKRTWLTCGIILGSITLSGCLPVVAAGAGGAATTAAYDKRTFKTMLRDNDLESQLGKQIQNDPQLQDTSVYINAINRSVLLTGEVHEASQRTKIYRLAQNLPHVKKVYNQIRVDHNAALKEHSMNAWLLTKVKSALLAQESLRSAQVKVAVDHGTVYLMGLIPPSQQQLAVDCARHVKGVEKVVTLFEDTGEDLG